MLLLQIPLISSMQSSQETKQLPHWHHCIILTSNISSNRMSKCQPSQPSICTAITPFPVHFCSRRDQNTKPNYQEPQKGLDWSRLCTAQCRNEDNKFRSTFVVHRRENVAALAPRHSLCMQWKNYAPFRNLLGKHKALPAHVSGGQTNKRLSRGNYLELWQSGAVLACTQALCSPACSQRPAQCGFEIAMCFSWTGFGGRKAQSTPQHTWLGKLFLWWLVWSWFVSKAK